MAELSPGAQYMNWQQYGGENSLLGNFGDSTKRWLGAAALQKSGAIDFLDSIGAPESVKKTLPKSSQPPAIPSSASPVIPPGDASAQPVVPSSAVAPQADQISIPAVGQIEGLSDKMEAAPDFLKMIWGG